MRTFILILLVGCGPAQKYTDGTSPTDMAKAMPASFCQSTGSRSTPEQGFWTAGCQTHCLPPEQVWTICTEKMGKIVATKAGLKTKQVFGASWEIKTSGCPAYPWRVWNLVYIDPQPSDVGRWSPPSIASDCDTSTLSGPINKSLDSLFYLPVSEVMPSVVQ